MLQPQREALAVYWQRRWDFSRFSILFRLFEALVFTPLAALVGHLLSGRPVVDSTDLVGFVLSPRGFAAAFLGAMLLVAIRLVEQAGLSAIALGAIGGHRVTSPTALQIVARLLPRLLAISAWLLLAGLVLAAPLLIVAAIFARQLLAQHDINYYLARHPPEFLTAVAVLAVIAIPTAIVAVWLAVRWRLVVPVVLCEPVSSLGALRSSARLARGNWRRTAIAWLVTELLILALGTFAALLGRLCSVGAAMLTADDAPSPVVLFVCLVVLRTLLTAFVTLPGPCAAAGVFAALYRDLRHADEPDWQRVFRESAVGPAPSRTAAIGRGLLAVLPLIMACLALVSTVAGMSVLYEDRSVAVTAHRGGTRHSIENTVAAIHEAIDDGAQFAEIDVQMSRDAVLVVTHDSDFSRQARDSRKVWELTYDEIRKIPLTNSKATEIAADHAPTLDEVLDAARGRIRLNIELKYYGDHQPGLAEKVVEAVRAKEMADQVIIQSLHYAGLEDSRRAAPEIPIGYLFSINAREPKRLDVDFLSVQLGRANGPFINAAHRRKQDVHVWTVDKPADMERLIDLGVDNLITNRPQEALALAREHAQLLPPQRALHRVRAWLVE
jgi:glycerophosphoryl diester phosphodiesterase